MKVFLSHTEQELPHSYSDESLSALQQHAEVVFNRTGRVLEGLELAQAAAGCEVIVAHRSTPGKAETFSASPDLIAFVRGAVDISTVDVDAASAAGILVTSGSPGFADAVAELGLGLMIDLARGLKRATMAYHSGQTPPSVAGVQLSSSTLGLVGYGRIARRLAAIAEGIGMQILVYDPYLEDVGQNVSRLPLNEVLERADFVVCLAAATPETFHMFDASTFGEMKDGTFFINLSRGELVDEDALEAALDSGRLRGAGLDVGSGPDQKPSARFVERPDVVATPHIGGVTGQAREHQAMHTIKQVAALAAGRMPEASVNPEAAYRLSERRR